MYDDKIIYGKNGTTGIVSIEVIDDKAEIFLQDGTSKIVPNSFWILAATQLGNDWARLKGNLYYKWGKKYNSLGAFYGAKKALRAKNIDFYCMPDEKESFMVKNGYTYYKGLTPKALSVLSFDIETTTLEHNDKAKILLISNTFRSGDNVVKRLFCYDDYETPGAMVTDWCSWVREMDPSIMLGHNVYSFDLPYLNFIAEQEGLGLNLGRNESPAKFFDYDSFKRIDGSREQAYRKVRIYGREVIDTMFLAINYDVGKKYESYGLKKIIAQEKLEAEDRTFYDASQIRNKYQIPEEWEKIKAYCSDDSDDALKLFDLMSPSFFYLTQSIPKSFQAITESASGSQLNSMMVRAYLQDAHSIPKTSAVQKFQGAISYGNPGVHRHCFKVDVASLYPSIMIQHEIYDRVKDPKGYMLQIAKTFTAERLKNKRLAKETKEKHYDDLQNAQKIVINSLYGFMGAAGLNFNSPANAALVTEHGRNILQKSIEWATGFKLKHVMTKKTAKKEEWEWLPDDKISEGGGFTLVNCDTDSITISLDNQELSEDQRLEILQAINSMYPERIRFEDDGYYLTIIVLRAKNYVLWDGKKMKLKGSALKDAKKEPALKEFMFKVVDSIIKGEDKIVEIYQEYVREALNISDIRRWASKKTISATVLTSERTNEAKIRDALDGTEFSEGDKVYMYFKSDESLGVVEKFDGDYSKEKMVEKVYKTALTFESIIPKDKFINYNLKRNRDALTKLI